MSNTHPDEVVCDNCGASIRARQLGDTPHYSAECGVCGNFHFFPHF
jgi:hypothetical protein